MKRKLIIGTVAICATMSLMTGCGDEKVKIQSRTEDHVKINGKGITYNPEEETNETETPPEHESTDETRNVAAGSVDDAHEEEAGMFKFGIDIDEESEPGSEGEGITE